ncbi:aspartate aminotransferase family protein [Chitinibacter sp. ZOR0017]|uniref:aspartate aminotransferase family protein n=1 Tax=Chitinibacter sp. ZOR0017 TaxID=1339254 RepID=UPI0006457869|nr:glutamate-1-semialdehyde 2,1-aminomutase [Chitinibacter sp. ZOR0017]
MTEQIMRGRKVIPGGVSSPLRACRNVDIEPIVTISGNGELIFDCNENKYIDFMYGFGPLILGHSHAVIVEAIQKQAKIGMLYGTMCLNEIELAEEIVKTAEFIEQVRFVCSGTEAVMSAIRLARAYTKRTKILRFKGGYHGHFDLVQNKSSSKYIESGLDPAAMESNIIVSYNNIEEVKNVFKKFHREIAAVVIEPIACNMSLIEPHSEFLKELRLICNQEESLLIFDEVISGFRFNYGPVSNLLGVEPDIVTFGKIIGGGTPVGAFGGRKVLMDLLDQEQILQGGTFAGNPLTMAAGLATLKVLSDPATYSELERKGKLLQDCIGKYKKEYDLNFIFARKGSVFAFIFLPEGHAIDDHEDISKQSSLIYARFYQEMRYRGYHLTPDVEETMYVSLASLDTSLERFAKDACEVIRDFRTFARNEPIL